MDPQRNLSSIFIGDGSAVPSGHAFSVFRILLGCYLVIHFSYLTAFANELLGSSGVINNPRVLESFSVFPNLLLWMGGGIWPGIFVSVLSLLSFLFLLGLQRRWMALLIWYGWSCIANRNPLMVDAMSGLLGWILLMCVLVPTGEPWSLGKKSMDWKYPPLLYWGAWLVVGAWVGVGAWEKLLSPSWRDGQAVQYLLESAFFGWAPWSPSVALWPVAVLKFLSRWILVFEVLFVPLALFQRSRRFAVLALVLSHGLLLLLLGRWDMLGVLLLTLFLLFDSRWLAPPADLKNSVVLFDGVCGLCNGVVDFVLANDERATFRFAPLQGKFGGKYLEDGQSMDTVMVVVSETVWEKSDAVSMILKGLGGIWFVGGVILRSIPRPLRDWGYRIVAKYRYQWFGQRETCRFPTPEERARFLD